MNTDKLTEIASDLENGGTTKKLAARRIRDWIYKNINIWPQTTDEYKRPNSWPVLPESVFCSMCGQDTRQITVCMCTACPRASRILC